MTLLDQRQRGLRRDERECNVKGGDDGGSGAVERIDGAGF
jgi:hypothetical protein